MSGHSFDSNILIDLLDGDIRAKAEIDRAERPWISRITWIEVMSKAGPTDERAMPLDALRRARCIQVVEVVLIVSPQHSARRVIPTSRRELMHFVQEPEALCAQ